MQPSASREKGGRAAIGTDQRAAAGLVVVEEVTAVEDKVDLRAAGQL
jgi:hypothetical protein